MKLTTPIVVLVTACLLTAVKAVLADEPCSLRDTCSPISNEQQVRPISAPSGAAEPPASSSVVSARRAGAFPESRLSVLAVIRYVLSTGNPQAGSEDYTMAGTVGQTVIETGQSEAYQCDPGLWGATGGNDTTCCMPLIRGNVDYDAGDAIDISDLVYLVDYMFTGGPEPPCLEEADMDATSEIDISDLVYLVDYMFTGGPPPLACP